MTRSTGWAWAGAALSLGLATAALAQSVTWTLAEPGRRLTGVAVNGEGNLAAVRVTGREVVDSIALVDLAASVAGRRVSAGTGDLSDPAWLDGDRVVVAEVSGLWIWDEAGEDPPVHWPMNLATPLLTASADGRRLAVAPASRRVEVMTSDTGALLGEVTTEGPLTALLLDADGGRLVTAEEGPGGGGRLSLWSTETGARLAEVVTRPADGLALDDKGLRVTTAGGVERRRTDDLAFVRRLPAGEGMIPLGDGRSLVVEGRNLVLVAPELDE